MEFCVFRCLLYTDRLDFPTLEHKAFKTHSKVGDLRTRPKHDRPAKRVVTETAAICLREIATYLDLPSYCKRNHLKKKKTLLGLF